MGRGPSKKSQSKYMANENFDYEMTDDTCSEKFEKIDTVKRIESCMTLSTNYDEDIQSALSSKGTSPFEIRRSDCT
jgi:hypothetical protein